MANGNTGLEFCRKKENFVFIGRGLKNVHHYKTWKSSLNMGYPVWTHIPVNQALVRDICSLWNLLLYECQDKETDI